MAKQSSALSAVVCTVAAVGFAAPAAAHHVMGGELPSTVWQGLLSGLGHPIIGLDHLAFVVGVGLMAHLTGRVVFLPLLFVAGTVLGCLVHVRGYDVPSPELAIALTVALAAGVVVTRARVPIGRLGALLVAAGALHGYAYGESIIGAEPAPLAAYIVGFGVSQCCLGVVSALGVRMIVAKDYLSERAAMRIAGAGIAVVAAVAFAGVAPPG
jgi:urease accessory protein